MPILRIEIMKSTPKIISIIAIAGIATAAGVTTVIAQSGDGDGSVGGDELARASAAALAEVGEGTVTGVEAEDGGYEVEVRRSDGSEADVELDRNFGVTGVERDGADDARDSDADRPVTDDQLARASEAALAATGGGQVTSVEADDHGYDVEIRMDDGTERDVELDDAFAVIHTETGADD